MEQDKGKPRKGRNYKIEPERTEDRYAGHRKLSQSLAKLVAQPEYQYLKELGDAIANADFLTTPKGLDGAIRFHYASMRKQTLDLFFKTVEDTAKMATRLPPAPDTKTKPSLFQDGESK